MNTQLGRVQLLGGVNAGGIRELLDPNILSRYRPPANRAGTWYAIHNAADDDRAVVELYDVIGEWGITALDFVRDLRSITASTIELHINSPGGLVYDGLTIYNALHDHPARVEAIVDGIAASSASWIFQAGEVRTMNRHTELMIHDALALTIGNEQDHLDSAELLARVSDNIAGIYAERAGGTVQDWRAAMVADTWYTADEAVEAGLADEAITAGGDAGNHSERARAATMRARQLERA